MNDRQNELGASFKLGVDFRGREDEILQFAKTHLDFVPNPDGFLGYSTWWGSDRAGAFRWKGIYKDRAALLKAQGVKPSTSEITALQGFQRANHSDLVRPPKLLASQPWNDDLNFELLVIEYIDSERLISYPTSSEQVAEFFRIFKDYRERSIGKPWVEKPTESLAVSTRKRIEEDLSMAEDLFPNHRLRKPDDHKLIYEGLAVLERHYENVEPEFQHTHISTDDVFKPIGQDPRYIYTSNFMWGWEAPYFDATYSYFHYDRLLADRYDQTDAALLKSQAKLWKTELYRLPHGDDQNLLLKAALLDKAVRALAISDLAGERSSASIAQDLIDLTRANIRELVKDLV